MADERFLGSNEMTRLTQAWPPIEHAGEIYFFIGNVRRSGREHREYQVLRAGGKHILIRENAVDAMGCPVPGMLAIYEARSNQLGAVGD